MQLANQFLVFTRARFREARDQLGSRDIVDGSHMNNGSLAPVFANGGRKPLKAFLVRGIARQQVPRIAQRHGSIALELSPDLHTLTRPLGGQCERQK